MVKRDGPSGLGNYFGVVDLGLRSRTRFSPGFHRTGFQPSEAGRVKTGQTGLEKVQVSVVLCCQSASKDIIKVAPEVGAYVRHEPNL